MGKIELKNVVIDGSFDIEIKAIPIEEIGKTYKDAEYKNSGFPAVTIRFTSPKSSVLLFRNGKFVITGLPSLESAEEAVKKLQSLLKNYKINAQNPKFKYNNLVVTGEVSVHKNVDLDMAMLTLDNAIYEPQEFPGLIITIKGEPFKRATFIIFKNGKANCVGLSVMEYIEKAFEEMSSIVQKMGLDQPQNDVTLPPVNIKDLL